MGCDDIAYGCGREGGAEPSGSRIIQGVSRGGANQSLAVYDSFG